MWLESRYMNGNGALDTVGEFSQFLKKLYNARRGRTAQKGRRAISATSKVLRSTEKIIPIWTTENSRLIVIS